jgi:hypothetical protein
VEGRALLLVLLLVLLLALLLVLLLPLVAVVVIVVVRLVLRCPVGTRVAGLPIVAGALTAARLAVVVTVGATTPAVVAGALPFVAIAAGAPLGVPALALHT